MKSFFENMYNKEIEIFNVKFKSVTFFTAMLFASLAIWSSITIVFLFMTGPFYVMVFWIFKLTFDITLVTYNFNMSRELAKG